MNPVTREQWTTALRSGEYVQATGQLYRRDLGYCCMGVLMSLAGAKPDETPSGMELEGYDIPSNAHIPTELAEMVGLGLHEQLKLAIINDKGYAFSEIADYISRLPFETKDALTNEPSYS